MTYYRDFSFSKLNTPKFSHLKLLIYWIFYGLAFFYVERIGTDRNWRYMESAFDGLIPFCEWFVFPYLFWFVYLIGMLLYTLIFDIPSFRRMMWFIICTYTITIIIYLIYPTAQNLRPDLDALGRDNFCIRFLRHFYAFDTNTNVNPSIHVIGSMSVLFTAWNSEKFSTRGWRVAFSVAAILICASTVFLKQHSIIDVVSALLLCLIFYPGIFKSRKTKTNPDTKTEKEETRATATKV